MSDRLDEILKSHSWTHICTLSCDESCDQAFTEVTDPAVKLLVETLQTLVTLKDAESSDPSFIAGYRTALELVHTIIDYKLNGLKGS